VRRLVTLLGLALSGLMFVACTSGSSAVNQGSPGTSGSTSARPTLAPACVTGLGDLYTAMTAIDDHIAGGMTLAAYSQAVASAALALNRVSSDQLDSHCVGHGYTPLKTAFGIYADASGTWTNCAQQTGCSMSDIESGLDQQWLQAHEQIAKVRAVWPVGS
jgi:hypothetical protein